MRETTLNKPFDRRFFIGLFAAVIPGAAAQGGATRRLSVREVVIMLKRAEDGRPPDLSRRDLSGLNLAELDFTGADLSESNLFGADLTGSNLEGANLSHAILDRSVLIRAQFTNANLTHASIRRPSVSSDLSFDSRELPVFRRANLAGVQLTARLEGADFSGADLSNASFTLWHERDLGGAPATGLDRCDFTGARMRGVNMRGLSLAYAVFRKADLRDADLRDTDLRSSDLTGALLERTRLQGARLDGVIGFSAPRGD
jgi:uncharacterized protein YjbI with pentapeptide repeats